MRVVVDMNLSPEWVETFGRHQIEALHWSKIGSPKAPDEEVLEWAKQNGCVLFSQDLDISQLLALAGAAAPSVILVRLENELDPVQRERVCRIVQEHAAALSKGALITISKSRARLRVLPI